jgi:hypothetical protein
VNSQSDRGTGECLTDHLLADYLEGALSTVVKAACEVHLIACDRCREKLATFMRILQPDVTPEEHIAVQKAVAQWEARDLHPIPHPRSWWKRASTFAAIAAVVVLGILWGIFRESTDDVIQNYLATNRPFEARLSGQPHVELVVTRSPEGRPGLGGLEEMTRRSADAYQRGRLSLIQRKYDEAIKHLTTAAADPQAPPDVLNDLGVSYLNRNRNGDLEFARRNFEAALVSDSKFRPAVFNLFLLYDLQGLTADADREKARYLDLDPDSDWAQELLKRN